MLSFLHDQIDQERLFIMITLTMVTEARFEKRDAMSEGSQAHEMRMRSKSTTGQGKSKIRQKAAPGAWLASLTLNAIHIPIHPSANKSAKAIVTKRRTVPADRPSFAPGMAPEFSVQKMPHSTSAIAATGPANCLPNARH